jgi:hypothetical protein
MVVELSLPLAAQPEQNFVTDHIGGCQVRFLPPVDVAVRAKGGAQSAETGDWFQVSGFRVQGRGQGSKERVSAFSKAGNLGESSADIPVGFGAFVNLRPTRMSAIHLGESSADIPVGFSAFANLRPTRMSAVQHLERGHIQPRSR